MEMASSLKVVSRLFYVGFFLFVLFRANLYKSCADFY